MNRIAIFASGSGSNAENIFNHFIGSDSTKIELILSNKQDAFVLERAKKLGVESIVFNRDTFYNTSEIVDLLKQRQINYIVLAGFLWLIPINIIEAYPNRIINIHPALLPKHGGKGMYGDKVHQAVIACGDSMSGITIHNVNEIYDSGDIIAQYTVAVEPTDTPDSLASKVHALEYKYFPQVIENELKK